MNNLTKKILRIANDWTESFMIRHKRKNEIKKFKDPRRVAIWSEVDLTEEQKKAIDALYVENYGEKIPYTWHRHYTAFTGRFDEKYFPELLFIPEFERFMSLHREYAQVFTDKNMLPMLAASVGVKSVKSFITSTKGALRDENYRSITREDAIEKLRNIGEVFIKPTVDTSSGVGCFIADFRGGVDTISGKTLTEILSGLGKDFAIQERFKCSAPVRDLNKPYRSALPSVRHVSFN